MENKFLEQDPILKNKDSINPYRHAIFEVIQRLKWDLTSAALASRKNLKKCKNIHQGKKVVITCNGPSLNKVDFDMLKGHYVISLNKINLLFDRTDFRPSYIVCVNPFVIEQNAAFFNETEIPLFLDTSAVKHVKQRSNVSFLHNSHQAKFARDISMSVWSGGTVTCVALQLAFHLGFSEVALVGCDHYFSSKGAANQLAESKGNDDSHFDPKYFANGMKWQLPDIPLSEFGYHLAKRNFEAFNRKIWNATDGGHLEIFDRISLAQFLQKA